ncbi:purine nucleoside permease [Chaetomium fimeti]|uniref:Purine nucleoside permease n=1 Tax=Chaetomium fimeti TaxID=1854472 RepID=A0AAE0LP68_9PEZI|nr:purine nucleoside permease [Chaetomium fimeti]
MVLRPPLGQLEATGLPTSRETPKEEADNWLADESAIKFTRKILLPGLSRGFDHVHSTADGSVCLLVVGTALINAALSVNTLVSSASFDLTKTYFILSGIAGGNPRLTTLGGVAFARFAVQVDTQMEWDSREMPSSWKAGYVPMGAHTPDSFPLGVHGSEVYELNDNLRQISIEFARQATLEDSKRAAATRAEYAGSPAILEGDVLSSNTFWHGFYLSEAMDNVTKVYTAGKGRYAMTAQEDTAILTALLRAALLGKADFSRILLMRAAANFDREPTMDVPPQLPWVMDSGGLVPAVRNLYNTGVKIINGILAGWSKRFEEGIEPDNYIGDIFGSLGGTPGFAPGGLGNSGSACSANKPLEPLVD